MSKFFITLSLLVLWSCGSSQSYSSSQDAYSKFLWSSCNQEDLNYLPEIINLNVPYTMQNYNYCGPAALSMVMQYHGFNVSQEDIGEGIVTNKGVTTEKLVKKAESYGFLAHVSTCSFSGLLSVLSQGTPVMARIINNTGNNGHFVVVTGYDMQLGLVYLNDPDKPNVSYQSFEDFKKLWDIKTLGDENSHNLTLVFYPPQLI
jgi:ABC-type bacteriocin/lantibiotic exporter with double-glycine peptidase domain